MVTVHKFKTPEDELKFYIDKSFEYIVQIDETYDEYKEYHKTAVDMETELEGYIYELEKSLNYYQDIMGSVLNQNQDLHNEMNELGMVPGSCD
ncbi:unnamed protein product [Diamesa serratosioi]